jgi:outer membrane protein TolC
LELAQTRLEVGLAPPLDVTRERAQLANNELNLLHAQNAVRLGRETLRTAIGIDEEVTFSLEPVPLPILPPLEEAALVEVAYERRPELASQRAQRQAATEEVAAAEKNHLPTIQGAGQYQWSGSDYPLQSNWNLGAVVTLPLFSGGLTAAQVSEAKARVREMEATETQLQQQIAFEVRQAFLQAREAEESLQVADRALEQAQENFTLAEGRYETGVGSVIELTDAQALLLNARGQRVQAEQNFLVAVAALEKATANPLAELASRAALVVRRSHEE